MTVREIAQRTSYEMSGDGDCQVKGISYAAHASSGEIAVVSTKEEIKTVRSDIILSPPFLDFSPKTFLYTHEPIQVAFVKVAKVLVEGGVCPDYSRPVLVPFSNNGFHVSPESKVGSGCNFGIGCIIHKDVWIGSNCSIGAYTEIRPGVIIGDNVTIGTNCCIGSHAFYRLCEGQQSLFCGIAGVSIENQVNIGNNVSIQRGVATDTHIGRNTIIGDLIDVGHDTFIGHDCFIVSQTGIAGNVQIGNHVTIYGQVGIKDGVTIGNHVTVYARSGVARDVEDGLEISGAPAVEHAADLRRMAKLFRSAKEVENG